MIKVSKILESAVAPMPKKYVPIEVRLKSVDTVLMGCCKLEGGSYEGTVEVLDKVVTGWGTSIQSCKRDLNENAQAYIDKCGVRESVSDNVYA